MNKKEQLKFLISKRDILNNVLEVLHEQYKALSEHPEYYTIEELAPLFHIVDTITYENECDELYSEIVDDIQKHLNMDCAEEEYFVTEDDTHTTAEEYCTPRINVVKDIIYIYNSQIKVIERV